MNENKFEIRVRYSETDQMGVVHHGSYIEYLEVARVELLRSKGVVYKEVEKEGFLLPVLNLEIKYIRPAFYDDLLCVEVMISSIKGSRIFFEYKIFNQKKVLVTTAKTTLVFMLKESKIVIKCPEWFNELF